MLDSQAMNWDIIWGLIASLLLLTSHSIEVTYRELQVGEPREDDEQITVGDGEVVSQQKLFASSQTGGHLLLSLGQTHFGDLKLQPKQIQVILASVCRVRIAKSERTSNEFKNRKQIPRLTLAAVTSSAAGRKRRPTPW